MKQFTEQDYMNISDIFFPKGLEDIKLSNPPRTKQELGKSIVETDEVIAHGFPARVYFRYYRYLESNDLLEAWSLISTQGEKRNNFIL